MRILNRPMFRYGGPIKEGIMHGVRSNYAGGRRAALVGDPNYPRTDGREHHVAPVVYGIGAGLARVLPWAARGAKAAWRFMKPTAKFRHPSVTQHPGASFKYTPAPYSAKEIAKNPKIWGQAIKENPGWALTGGASIYNAPGTYEAAKGAGGLGWKALKQAADLAVPDWIWDQDKWEKERAEKQKPPSGIIKPGGFKKIIEEEKPDGPSAAELAAKAKAARNAKLEKYLDTMGYDKAKKTAMGDALIDASAIVQDATTEAGSLKKADWGKMINRAIQSTSKRLDKPEQIREAVGLMMTKADIEKDATAEEDALNKLYKTMQIKGAQKTLAGSTLAEDIAESFVRNQKLPSGATLAGLARTKGIDAKVLPISEIPKDMSAIDYITIKIKESADKGTPLPEGNYVIKDRLLYVDETGTITDLINQ